VTVYPTTTVYDVMSSIWQRTGLPPTVQRLHYAGKDLISNCQLSDYSISPGATIHVLLRLLGGGNNNIPGTERARNLYAHPPPPPSPPIPSPLNVQRDDGSFQIFCTIDQTRPPRRDMRKTWESNWQDVFRELVMLHQPVRMRLRMTCHYFNSLYALAIFVSFMLVCASIADFNDLIIRRDPVWHFVIQDAFFLLLGITAMYGSLWVTSNLTNYWYRFVQRINELPQFLLTHPAAHSGLVAYFKTAEVSYTVFGWPVNSSLIYTIITSWIKILFVALIIYNWRYFPQQNGTINLSPGEPGPLP
jgi:hypothetical protein